MDKQASSRVDQIGVIARRIPWALLILVHLPVFDTLYAWYPCRRYPTNGG